MMSTLAQTFAGAKTFAYLLTASVGVLTSLVRAAAASLVLRSDVGALSTDVAVKVGTSVSDGSVHASAKVLAAFAGLGGTEVEKFSVLKDGTMRNAGGMWRGSSASAGYFFVNDISGAGFAYGSNSFSVVGGGISASAGGGGIDFVAATTASYRANQFNTLFSLRGDLAAHVCNYVGSGLADGVVNAAAKLTSFGTGINGTYVEKFFVRANGEIESTVIGAGFVLRSPDGTRYRITVANGGTLSVAPA